MPAGPTARRVFSAADRLAAFLMLAVTPQFDLLAFLLAVLAAVLAVRPAFRHGALAARVGTLRFGLDVWHGLSPLAAEIMGPCDE